MQIEEAIYENLIGDTQKNALDFVTFIRENDMHLEREVGGYWDDKLYYDIVFNSQFVGFILVTQLSHTESLSLSLIRLGKSAIKYVTNSST